ncbi:hypothetical protein GTY54_00680 [Streptomyces sp. SID625]|nr:hypothetical protein [Streptomyces sp. SID625]
MSRTARLLAAAGLGALLATVGAASAAPGVIGWDSVQATDSGSQVIGWDTVSGRTDVIGWD